MTDPLVNMGLRIWTEEMVNLLFSQSLILAAGLGVLAAARNVSAVTRRWVLTGLFTMVLAMPWVSNLLPRLNLNLLPSLSLGGGEIEIIEQPATSIFTLTEHQPDAILSLSARPKGVALFFILWTLGTMALLMRWIGALLRRQRLARRGRVLLDPLWLARARSVSDGLNFRRPVTFLLSDEEIIPHTWGLYRPVVALPSSALEWNESILRMVLSHELAHVKAGDVWVMGVAQITAVLFWPNPLLWMALRWLVAAREQACDNAVLASGVKASDYASYLLDLCRQLAIRPIRPLPAMSMVGRGSIEHRLMAVLDPSSRRSDLSWPIKGLIFLLLLLGWGWAGRMQAWARGTASPSQQWMEMRQVRQNLNHYAQGLTAGDAAQVAACYGDGYFPAGTGDLRAARQRLASQIGEVWIDDFQSVRASMKLNRLDRVGDEYIAIADLKVQGRLQRGQEARMENRDWLLRYQNENGIWRIRDIYTRSTGNSKVK